MLQLTELSNRDREAWADLAGRTLEPNPFAEPDFALAAQRELAPRSVGLLVTDDAGDLTAALPVVNGRWRGVLPSLSTWRHPYVFLGTPLLDRSSPEAALASLLEAASLQHPHGYVVLEWLLAEGPLRQALEAALARTGLMTVGSSSHARAALRRRSGADYQDHMRPHHRRELGRLGRRLGDELGSQLETVDRADDPEAVRQFLALEASGWKGNTGTAMRSNDAHGRFFEEICRRFSSSGRLQLLDMQADGRSVAMKCNLVAERGIFCFKIAHDAGLARFSPGVQLELANVRRFHERGEADWMDSCAAPDNQMINRLWPDRRRIETFVLARPGLRGRLTRRALAAVHVPRGHCPHPEHAVERPLDKEGYHPNEHADHNRPPGVRRQLRAQALSDLPPARRAPAALARIARPAGRLPARGEGRAQPGRRARDPAER